MSQENVGFVAEYRARARARARGSSLARPSMASIDWEVGWRRSGNEAVVSSCTKGGGTE